MANKLFNKEKSGQSNALQHQLAMKELTDGMCASEIAEQIEFLHQLHLRQQESELNDSQNLDTEMKSKELLIQQLKLELLELKQAKTDEISKLQHKFELDKTDLISKYEDKIIENKKSNSELNMEITRLSQEIAKHKQQLELELELKQSEKDTLVNNFTENKNQLHLKIKYLEQQNKSLEQEIEKIRMDCNKQIQYLQQTLEMEKAAKINDLAQANRNYESELRFQGNKVELLKSHLLEKQNELVEHDKNLTRELKQLKSSYESQIKYLEMQLKAERESKSD